MSDEQAAKIQTVGPGRRLRARHHAPDAILSALSRLQRSTTCSTRCRSDLARQAVTHASWVERRSESYERLAFLGDSVLGLAVTTHL